MIQELLDQFSLFGHAGAAATFTALAIWQWQRTTERTRLHLFLVMAVALTAFWGLAVAVEGSFSPIGQFAETLRNGGWLIFMWQLLKSGEGRQEPRTINYIYLVLALVLVAQVMVDSLVPVFAGVPKLVDITAYTALVLRMIFAVGALVLIHNLYTISARELRWGIRLPMAAIAAMWTYDLNLFTIFYLTRSVPVELVAMRGFAVALLSPVLVLGFLRNNDWQFKLSRSVAFRSLSLVAIAGYLGTMVVIVAALQIIGGDYALLAQISFLFGASIAALLLMPSGRFRSWLKVSIAKNFFQHRYDYRQEWMRFTDTIGRPDNESAALHVRVVKAIADITDSPAGLLLMPDQDGRLLVQARWNWQNLDLPARLCTPSTTRFFGSTAHIAELDAIRSGTDERCQVTAIPGWMLSERQAWAAVPLVHFDRLAGIVVLARPRVNRTLDWEDLDMLRIVGRQVASYLAEANSQAALSEAERFDEFNRRMAFIMHDLKNMVSQLTLLARNAERHADNPEFRTDMIATLQESASKMNALLARLSQHNKSRVEEPRPMDIAALAKRLSRRQGLSNPVELGSVEALNVQGDPARVEQILLHLIQNACEASPPEAPVRISVLRRGDMAAVEVLDHGHGMTGEFIRNQLFKPFASTKADGFGIGAYEARSLALAMHGQLEVESKLEEGSRFTLLLPLASTITQNNNIAERAA